MKKNNSFVLIFTLTILSLTTIITYQLMKLVYVGTHFDQAMVDRENAEMLALGGINLAMSKLLIKSPFAKASGDKDEAEKKKQEKKEFENFLKHTLPNINRWQEFDLKEEIDGIDGQVKICISCENSKININESFDFKKNEFKEEYKKFLNTIKFKSGDQTSSKFLKKLTDFLKKRGKKLDDLSELQTGALTEIQQFFYNPPIRTEKKKDAKPNQSLAIQDIFTIWSKTNKIEALFLSDSMCAILGLRRPTSYDSEILKEKFKNVIKNFDQGKDENTEEYWKIVRPIYEGKTKFKIEDKKIFSLRFEPKVYSVISFGKVGNVEQRLLAIIEKNPNYDKASTDKTAGKEKENEDKEKGSTSSTIEDTKPFKILRLYWI